MTDRNDRPKTKAPQTVVLPDRSELIYYDQDVIDRHQVGTTSDGKPILRPPVPPATRQPGDAVSITTWH